MFSAKLKFDCYKKLNIILLNNNKYLKNIGYLRCVNFLQKSPLKVLKAVSLRSPSLTCKTTRMPKGLSVNSDSLLKMYKDVLFSPTSMAWIWPPTSYVLWSKNGKPLSKPMLMWKPLMDIYYVFSALVSPTKISLAREKLATLNMLR